MGIPTCLAKPTLVESFTLNQVLYRTLSGNSFTESSESVAARTLCDRKTVLKGLKIAVEQNILSENKRAGTSSEYQFLPYSEWLPQPVVHIKDIRNSKIVEFPKTQNTESEEINRGDEVVLSKDYHITDSNTLVIVNKLLETTTEEVSTHSKDTPSIWRSLPDGSRYAQIPPIHDQDTGVEIQRQMHVEGLTAQKVISRAVAFTKVPLMLLELLGNIGKALASSCPQEMSDKTVAQSQADAEVEVLVSLQLSKTLEIIGVNLSNRQLQKCVQQYGEDIMLNAALDLKKTGVLANKENPSGYFIGCLKNGMGKKPATVQKETNDAEEEPAVPKCSITEMGQAIKKPERSFSQVETNPRVTIASLIIDGQYQRAAILSGLYGVDYEELLLECGLADDPRAVVLSRRVT